MLSGFRLTLRRLQDDRLVLTVPRWFRLLLLAFGLVLFYALTATEGIGGVFTASNLVPLAICALSLLGAGYLERWTFERGANRCVHEVGLLMLRRRRAWALSELEEVEVGQFIRGRPHASADTRPGILARPVVTLTLRWKQGDAQRLDLYSYSQKPKVREYALAIASYCGIQMVDRSAGQGEAAGH